MGSLVFVFIIVFRTIIVNQRTIIVHIAQFYLLLFVQCHDSLNYFEKAIDFLCDVCYTVITEEQELLREAQGQAIS